MFDFQSKRIIILSKEVNIYAFIALFQLIIMLSIVLIGLSQMTDGSGGGWNDVIYMVFGVLILIANVVLTSIVLVVRLYRNNKDQ